MTDPPEEKQPVVSILRRYRIPWIELHFLCPNSLLWTASEISLTGRHILADAFLQRTITIPFVFLRTNKSPSCFCSVLVKRLTHVIFSCWQRRRQEAEPVISWGSLRVYSVSRERGEKKELLMYKLCNCVKTNKSTFLKTGQTLKLGATHTYTTTPDRK